MIDNKIVIIINGNGGVGKDTLCDLLARHYSVKKISSITPIKRMATICGWNGEKDEKSRKFLSELKRLLIDYNDYPNRYLIDEYVEFLNSDNQILFVQIREGNEIKKFKENISSRCVTLLIKREFDKNLKWGNASDDEAENYSYDYIFENSNSLEESELLFKNFIDSIIEKQGN